MSRCCAPCASKTRGGYFSASRPGGELPRLVASLSSLARSGRGQRLIERPVSRFPLLAALAALLLHARPRPRAPTRRDTRSTRGRRCARARFAGASRSRAPRRRGRGADHARRAGGIPAGCACAERVGARRSPRSSAGRWSAAESLYTLRLQHGQVRAAQVNRSTARARRGAGAEAETELGTLASREDAAGRAAGYNLGTLQAERQDYEHALAELRRSLRARSLGCRRALELRACDAAQAGARESQAAAAEFEAAAAAQRAEWRRQGRAATVARHALERAATATFAGVARALAEHRPGHERRA